MTRCEGECKACDNAERVEKERRVKMSWQERIMEDMREDLIKKREERKLELEKTGMKEYWDCDHEKARWGGYIRINNDPVRKTKYCPTCGHIEEFTLMLS